MAEKGYIRVGMSTCGLAAGARAVFDVLRQEISKRELGLDVKKTGCLGMCSVEPLVEVNIPGLPRVVYGNVDEDVALKIVEGHLCTHNLLNDYIVLILEG